jgi:3-mercaptopropionate dioxygenase
MPTPTPFSIPTPEPPVVPPVTLAPPLDRFIAAIEQLHDDEPDAARVVSGVQTQLAHLLAAPLILCPEQREPWADHYRTHLLAVAPSSRFSVVAMVWLPGQVTPIHDHRCWCVVGVLEGFEREQRFSLREDDSGRRWLVPGADVLISPGVTSALVPPEENIHQVRNAGAELALSVHVYGADLRGAPSSINQCFDELPIDPERRAGHPVAWRRI